MQKTAISCPLVVSYFPNLSPIQIQQFSSLIEELKQWNQKINLISRKNIDLIEEQHILHSLAIAKCTSFSKNTKILDIGTGGGFPGIPLAILYPNSNFLLVDSIGKKIRVVNEIIKSLNLKNAKGLHSRAEDVKDTFDNIVSRAVAPTVTLLAWTKHQAIKNKTRYYFLKGGDLNKELSEIGYKVSLFSLSSYFKEPFFESKKVVCIKA